MEGLRTGASVGYRIDPAVDEAGRLRLTKEIDRRFAVMYAESKRVSSRVA